jgi:predicted dienelactone hydrolase
MKPVARIDIVVIGLGLALVAACNEEPGPTAVQLQPPTALYNRGQSPQLLALPAPTGPFRVGTTSLHLIDNSRVDPLAPTPRARELMVRLWYPAAASHDARHQPIAPYLPAGVSRNFMEFINAVGGTTHPADLLTFPTNSRQDAPAAAGAHRPTILFSHGFGVSAAIYSGLHEELASRGYVVVGIEHTFDAGAVQFPDGRLEVQKPGIVIDDMLRAVRSADIRFVLDALVALAEGRNPDAGQRRLPAGLGRSLDLTRVGAFGHSLGSPALIAAMERDRRIDVGIALDGDLVTTGLDRPFLMIGNEAQRRADNPEWAAFYDNLSGPRLYVVIEGAAHSDLSDITLFKSTINLAVFGPGPIDGQRALTIQRAYVTAWLDQALYGRRSPLLKDESRKYPEIEFQR